MRFFPRWPCRSFGGLRRAPDSLSYERGVEVHLTRPTARVIFRFGVTTETGIS